MTTFHAAEALSPRTELRRPWERGLWEYRELLRSLVLRNLKVKYQRSALGFVWTLLNPLVTVGILAAVFSHVVRIPLPAYWAFLLSGYFVWNFVIQTLNTGSYVFGEHSRLLRSAAFRPELLVLGAALAKLLEFAAAMALVLGAVAVFHHGGIPSSWVLLPLLVLAQLFLVTGLTFPIAMTSAFYYDVQHALPIALTTLFYVSPVFYPATMVPEAVRPLYMLNPVAGLLTLYHEVVYAGRFPSALLLASTITASIAFYFVGYAIFRRYASVYAEIV
jgi:lipopolysaccharide transport system permease protein